MTNAGTLQSAGKCSRSSAADSEKNDPSPAAAIKNPIGLSGPVRPDHSLIVHPTRPTTNPTQNGRADHSLEQTSPATSKGPTTQENLQRGEPPLPTIELTADAQARYFLPFRHETVIT